MRAISINLRAMVSLEKDDSCFGLDLSDLKGLGMCIPSLHKLFEYEIVWF